MNYSTLEPSVELERGLESSPRSVGKYKIVLPIVLLATVIGSIIVFVLFVSPQNPRIVDPVLTDTPVELDVAEKAAIPDMTFVPFCNGACGDPRNIYGAGSLLNFPASANPIPRSTPDGINPWPTSTGCGNVQNQVLPRAAWWDSFTTQQALPTNTWWVPYFSNPPFSTNPSGYAWPVYALPYTTLAAQNGFKMGYPTPQRSDGKPGAWDGSVPPMVQMGMIAQMFTYQTTDGFKNEKRITSYDRDGFGVTLQYSPNNGGYMSVPVFRGSPYFTVIYAGTTPMIDYEQGDIMSVNGVDTLNVASATVSPRLISGGIYGYDIWISMGVNVMYKWRFYMNQNIPITISKPYPNPNGCGVIPWRIAFTKPCTQQCVTRLALYYNVYEDSRMPVPFYKDGFSVDPNVLDRSANVLPIVPPTTTRSVGFAYTTSNTIRTTFRWRLACMAPAFNTCVTSNFLMLSLPHHMELFTSAQKLKLVPQVTYSTMKGFATGVLGQTWTMVYTVSKVIGNTLTGDPFRFRTKVTDPAKNNVLLSTLQKDLNFWTSTESHPLWINGDCYYSGKLLAMVSRLTQIADEMNQTALADRARSVLRSRLSQWLDPTTTDPVYPFKTDKQLIYDTTWGGITPISGINNPGPYWKQGGGLVEFGSGGYNDHLFHYGYFLNAVATVLYSGKSVDIEWYRKVENRVLALARDIANPSQSEDPFFAQFRHKSDWYAGHSWAVGLYPSGNYPNMESSSEAINAWYGLYLFGHSLSKIGTKTLGNSIMNISKILAVTDIQSFNHYVHLYPDWNRLDLPSMRNKIYPNEFTQLGVVGNLWSGQVVHQTFWGYGECECKDSPLPQPGCAVRHSLTNDQVRYYNSLFILMIQFMPFTPFTNAYADRQWISQMFNTPKLAFTQPDGTVSYGYTPVGKANFLPDIYGKCQQQVSTLACDGWIVYAWQVYSMINGGNRDHAWNELVQYQSAALGNTMTNALHFVASQPN